MAPAVLGGGAAAGAASPQGGRGAALRIVLALALAAALVIAAFALQSTPGRGSTAAFSLLIGAALGIVFERGRFCFFCILRDFIEHKNSTGLYAILAALAAGGLGYAIVFSVFLPNPAAGRLPPQAHIGPVSWVLLAAGIAFGVGMALSGACISGHLYRLGQGYLRAPIALAGTLVGFGAGFVSWNALYLDTLSTAPVAWLPASLGYGGALIVHLLVLAGLALLLLRFLPPLAESAGGAITLARIRHTLLGRRWNPLVTGALVGLLGMLAYFRVEPLGVTAQLGSVTRTVMHNAGWLPDRLNGLDGFAGCATVVAEFISDNGLLIGGLVVGSLLISLLANTFSLSQLTLRNSLTALLGGVLMGWGAMVALGCTVGTLLSGISAFALSGWVFGAAVFAGVWLGIRLRLHQG